MSLLCVSIPLLVCSDGHNGTNDVKCHQKHLKGPIISQPLFLFISLLGLFFSFHPSCRYL